MYIQKLVLPKKTENSEQDLYYRLKQSAVVADNGEINFKRGSSVSFDTYFNGFSVGKWLKYTVVEQIQIMLDIVGEFKISLFHAYVSGPRTEKKLLFEQTVCSMTRGNCLIETVPLKKEGIFYLEIKALENNGCLFSGGYAIEAEQPKNQVKIAIDICTFKREEYVKRNIELLKRDILENKSSLLYERMIVNIADNASSLGGIVDNSKNVYVRKNANVGGVGGFTRGIIETLKMKEQEQITHVLIMDDDAVISTTAIERTYMLLSFLKDAYLSYTIGGQLLRLDKKHVQFESGAQWNQGDIKVIHHNVDLSNLENVLKNDQENEIIEYAGWWYCCIPLNSISEDNLPLPIFIHRDDIEYGIRVGREKFIFLNGIGIWHESFAGKMPGVLEYYDIRNQAIVNAIHYPMYNKRQFKRLILKWVSLNVARYRYEYVKYNLMAAQDFCKGIDWLLQEDAVKLHKSLLEMNYKMKPVKEYIGYKGLKKEDFDLDFDEKCEMHKVMRVLYQVTMNGYFLPADKRKVFLSIPNGNVYKLYRAKEVLILDAYGNALLVKRSIKEFLRCYKMMIQTLKLVDKYYEQAKQSYHMRWKELTNIEFWNKYLDIQ